MRTLPFVVAAVILTLAAYPAVAAPPATVSGQAFVPTLTVYVEGQTVGGKQVFSPNVILLPTTPIHLQLTFHDNDTLQHTFTINDVNGTQKINTGYLSANATATLNFTVVNLTATAGIIGYNGTTFSAEMGANGILWYCIPHRSAGMTGQIELASAQQAAAAPDKGVLIRAYWIGIIGIAAMLVWIGISYFVIKSSSPHFRDNREHLRKGLP